MSVESAQKFVEDVHADEDLNKEVAACEKPSQAIALAKEKGYDFTEDELKQVKTALTDDELDRINGGINWSASCWFAGDG